MGFPGCGRREGSVERPWGWIVMVAAFLVHILSYGLAWSTGVLNAIFLDTFNVPVVYISWVGTLVLGNMLASGVLAGIAINRFGCRVTALLGGALTSGGLVLSFFAPNIYFLYFSLGFVTGFGGGLSFLSSVAAVTHWFDERRSIALGVTSAGLGFGQFLFPALIRWLYQIYDWTGVLLILGGISLNILVGGATFRPTVYSGRKPKPHPDEDESPQTHFHCYVFKNPGFLSMCLNNVLVCFGLSIMYIHLPAYGESVGIDPNKSALLMSAMGLANVFGRVAYGAFDQYFTQKTCLLYGGSFVLAGVIVAVVPTTANYPLQVLFSGLFGFATGSFGVLLAQIVAQLVGVTDFAAAYGYLLLFEGLGTMSGGPTAGFLYDLTRTYTTSLYVSGACLVVSAACVVVPHLTIVRPKLGLQITVDEVLTADRSPNETSA